MNSIGPKGANRVADPAFLLDSNICIYILEGRHSRLRERVEACRPGELATSAIAYAEVMLGIDTDDARQQKAADRLFDLITVIPFDQPAALAYARLPFRRHRFDRLIAAHALSRGLTLVTNNGGDFDDIAGLRHENWTL